MAHTAIGNALQESFSDGFPASADASVVVPDTVGVATTVRNTKPSDCMKAFLCTAILLACMPNTLHFGRRLLHPSISAVAILIELVVASLLAAAVLKLR